MGTNLGDKLRRRRTKLGLTLRQVERDTGIHNAHLSQIEKGGIEKPDPNILWRLSGLYRLDFQQLMRLAGHTKGQPSSTSRPLLGVALRAIGELSADEQRDVLQYIEQIRQARSKENRTE